MVSEGGSASNSVAAEDALREALYREIGKRMTDARLDEILRQVAIPLHGRGPSVDLQARHAAALVRSDMMQAVDAALAESESPPASQEVTE